MPFRSVSIGLTRETAEAFADLLMDEGALSVSVEDADAGTASEQPIFGEPGASGGVWDRCELTALFDADADFNTAMWQVASALGITELNFKVTEVPDNDWVRETQAQFQPIVISSRITIVPTWHVPANEQPDAINIILDPGAAFGTGSHPTTRLCLRWLEKNVSAADGVLDYGTGSGILAIAAMKLGAREAVGVDIDQAAVEAARYNAEQNHVGIKVDTTENVLDYVADITVANILANPLKVLAPLLAARTRQGGALVLAGLLDEQANELIDIYAPWFVLSVWDHAEGWSCLAGRRK